MKIISFDVGIKNMAYCILDCSSNIIVPNIIDWNIVNLLNNTEDTNMICNQICKNKKNVIVNLNIESQRIIIVKNTQKHQNFTFQKRQTLQATL